MKKLIIASTMVAYLVVSAAVAFGVGQTIAIAWFVNDFNGVFFSDFDTWLTLKNVTGDYITLTLDYYDDSNFLTIATTDTVVVAPQGVSAYYTGKAAYNQDFTFIGDGFNMGNAADRGSINIRFPDQGLPGANVIQGYQGISDYVSQQGLGLNLQYLD